MSGCTKSGINGQRICGINQANGKAADRDGSNRFRPKAKEGTTAGSVHMGTPLGSSEGAKRVGPRGRRSHVFDPGVAVVGDQAILLNVSYQFMIACNGSRQRAVPPSDETLSDTAEMFEGPSDQVRTLIWFRAR